MYKKNSNLSTIQRKYCSCLLKVRSKKNSPYGICTKSVYGSRNLKRNKTIKCSKSYKIPNLTKKQLYNLAKEKKVKVSKKTNRPTLMRLLRKKIYKD
jgi:hypothetical protein